VRQCCGSLGARALGLASSHAHVARNVLDGCVYRKPYAAFFQVKFPVTGQKFPVPRNIFPVNCLREFREKWLQHSGFLLRNRPLRAPESQHSLQNSLLAGNLCGDGCDQHCSPSQPVRQRGIFLVTPQKCPPLAGLLVAPGGADVRECAILSGTVSLAGLGRHTQSRPFMGAQINQQSGRNRTADR
jgi:hypothetical protein